LNLILCRSLRFDRSLRKAIAKLALEFDIPDLDKVCKPLPVKIKTVTIQKKKIIISPVPVDCCSFCGSKEFVKGGKRYNKNFTIQRYQCKNEICKQTFSDNLGFARVSVKASVIIQALELYFSGISYRGIASFLQMQEIQISYTAVSNWIKKYIKLMKVFLDQFTPQVSDKWRCDEIYVKIAGEPKYFFVMMDDATRFILAYYIADTKKTHNANRLLRVAMTKAGKKPKVFTSDGLQSYRKAYEEIFFDYNDPTIHIRATYSHNNKWMNNLMERWNGSFRHRQKTLRGIKTKDSIFFDGFIIYYNFIRLHQKLKTTPGEKAGIIIEGNKWETLIQNAENERKCQS